MKRNKIVITIIMVFVMMLANINLVFARESKNKLESADEAVQAQAIETGSIISANELAALKMYESTTLDDGAIITRVPKDVFSAGGSEKNGELGYSFSERLTAKSGGYSYYLYSNTKELFGSRFSFKATLEARIELYVSGSNAQITNVSQVSTRIAPGVSIGTWTQTSAGYRVLYPSNGTFPAGKVEIYGSGYVTVSASVNAGVSIVLAELGFSLNSLGWTSPTKYISGTYQCYH